MNYNYTYKQSFNYLSIKKYDFSVILYYILIIALFIKEQIAGVSRFCRCTVKNSRQRNTTGYGGGTVTARMRFFIYVYVFNR